jgi:hypothetical protein
MSRRWYVVASLVVLLAAAGARADVMPCPQAVREMHVPHDEVHVLRTLADGTSIGEQRFHAVVENGTLVLTVVTHFTNGEQWDEHDEMDLSKGYRAKLFHKVERVGGKVVAEQQVDFTSGHVSWLRDGTRGEQTFTFTPDTYIGPMLGVVLADVPDSTNRAASIQTIVFRPDPEIYTLRADVMQEENFKVGNTSEPTTKVRLKADLGAVQNVLFASMIPTHYFWFTRVRPEFFAFEGSLGWWRAGAADGSSALGDEHRQSGLIRVAERVARRARPSPLAGEGRDERERRAVADLGCGRRLWACIAAARRALIVRPRIRRRGVASTSRRAAGTRRRAAAGPRRMPMPRSITATRIRAARRVQSGVGDDPVPAGFRRWRRSSLQRPRPAENLRAFSEARLVRISTSAAADQRDRPTSTVTGVPGPRCAHVLGDFRHDRVT